MSRAALSMGINLRNLMLYSNKTCAKAREYWKNAGGKPAWKSLTADEQHMIISLMLANERAKNVTKSNK